MITMANKTVATLAAIVAAERVVDGDMDLPPQYKT
jgi:hypothetical protein